MLSRRTAAGKIKGIQDMTCVYWNKSGSSMPSAELLLETDPGGVCFPRQKQRLLVSWPAIHELQEPIADSSLKGDDQKSFCKEILVQAARAPEPSVRSQEKVPNGNLNSQQE